MMISITSVVRIAVHSVLVPALAATLCVGCSVIGAYQTSSLNQHQVRCAGKQRADVVNDLAAMIAAEGFSIVQYYERAGIVEGARIDGGETVRWQFLYRNDTVFAFATEYGEGASTSNSTITDVPYGTTSTVKTSTSNNPYNVSLDDRASRSRHWYWNVRQALENYCGAKAVIRVIER